ncbi:YchJ family metal-binding protein [Microbacterium pygmaeum]|uniref:YchJ family metal-binding protein n=1 Tax=Microbacterium pygmaeum TaxID=370764 RepID=UPI002682292A
MDRLADRPLDGRGRWEAAGTVEFRASWVTRSGERGVLRETSRFERRGGRWLYLDGEVF